MDDCQAPAGAAFAQIRLGVAFEQNGTCYFSGVELEEMAAGDPFAHRVATFSFTSQEPAMEDFFNPKHWENASRLTDFTIPAANTRAKCQTIVRGLYGKDVLFLNIECSQEAADQIKTDDRRGIDQKDAIEVFLLPPKAERQYHLILSLDGKLFTCTERWNDGFWPMKLDPWPDNGVETKVERSQNGWRAGFRIPFKTMGQTMPTDGAEWLANFCRSVQTGAKELSAWSALREGHFQFTGDFGKIAFSHETPVVRSLNINAEGATMEIANPTVAPLEMSAAFVRHTESGGAAQTRSDSFTIPPGKTLMRNLEAKVADAEMRYLEIRSNGTLVLKSGNLPSEEFFALGIFDPEKARGDAHYLAVDTPVLPGA